MWRFVMIWGFPSHGGTPKSSILVGFSIINHPAIGISPFQEPTIYRSNLEVLTRSRVRTTEKKRTLEIILVIWSDFKMPRSKEVQGEFVVVSSRLAVIGLKVNRLNKVVP